MVFQYYSITQVSLCLFFRVHSQKVQGSSLALNGIKANPPGMCGAGFAFLLKCFALGTVNP